MSGSFEPNTPPPTALRRACLPTPPSTGRCQKSVRFALVDHPPDKDSKAWRKQFKERIRHNRLHLGVADYTQIQNEIDELDLLLSNKSETRRSAVHDGVFVIAESLAPPRRSAKFVTPLAAPTQISSNFVNTCSSITAVEQFPSIPTRSLNLPFPFLSLPSSVRRKIYTLLLTVSGIICVRPNRTCDVHLPGGIVYTNAESLALLPGISYALVQKRPSSSKRSMKLEKHFNVKILFVCKEIHYEAKQILYSANTFELRNLTGQRETGLGFTVPLADFSVPLFKQYQGLVQDLCIQAHEFGHFRWVVNQGWRELEAAYPGLRSLTLILRLNVLDLPHRNMFKGKCEEVDGKYARRLSHILRNKLSGPEKCSIPLWMHLRIVYGRESFEQILQTGVPGTEALPKMASEEEDFVGDDLAANLKSGMTLAWEMFKIEERKVNTVGGSHQRRLESELKLRKIVEGEVTSKEKEEEISQRGNCLEELPPEIV